MLNLPKSSITEYAPSKQKPHPLSTEQMSLIESIKDGWLLHKNLLTFNWTLSKGDYVRTVYKPTAKGLLERGIIQADTSNSTTTKLPYKLK